MLLLLAAGCGREDIELYPGASVTPRVGPNTPSSDGPGGPMIGSPDEPPEPEQCGAVAPPGLRSALPPMGWNGWNSFACSPELDDPRVRGIADALTASGMQAAGYHYVDLDDCWELARSASGDIIVDPARLPSGMEALSLALHSQGFKLGVFRRGADCAQTPPERYTADAATYASWGIDLLKQVTCKAQTPDTQLDFEQMSAALESSGRSVVLSITAPPFAEWMPNVGQTFRSSPAISPTWASLLEVLDATTPLAAYARPGAFNDPDMLEVGNGELTESEARAHFSLWSILSAPLLAGNDVSAMSEATRQILTNQEVIALDQDPLGLQGALVRREGDLDVYAKPLASCGARGVVLFNRGSSSLDTTLSWPEIWLEPGSASVRDLWSHIDLGAATDEVTLTVPPHDVLALQVVGPEPAGPRGEVWLGDAPFTYVTNGYGPVERNTSNGELAAGDGHPMSMRGRVYQRGLGVHPPSLMRFRLGGACSRFTAEVGVDDEEAGLGSVVFQVWSDGEKLFDSGLVTGSTPPRQVDVSLENRMDLRLLVAMTADGDGNDHADWAEARLTCAGDSVAR